MLGMLLENVQGKPYAELIDELAKELGSRTRATTATVN